MADRPRVQVTREHGPALDEIAIEVKQHEGAWRVFAVDPRSALEEAPLSQRGGVLGGTWEQAIADAERVAAEMGFVFLRPSGLWQPSPSSKLILPGARRSN